MILLEKQAPNLDNKLINENLSLILNNIQDPGNLGTIWRIADWFDIKHVFCSPNCVDLYNNKVIQSSMGAFLRVPAQEVEIAELLETHSDVPVYGATLGGKNIFKTNLTKNGFIIIGNESRGIEANLLPQIDHQIAIPQNGNAESLNASVATGIICAAFRNLN